MENISRPVQLQVNTAGAWKSVLQFDAGNADAVAVVHQAVAMLHEVDPSSKWQIATLGKPPTVLARLNKNTYGLWIERKEAA